MDGRVVFEKLGGYVDAHRQHIGNRLAPIAHGKRLTVELSAMAQGACDKQVGQKPHLDPLHALALASVAAPARMAKSLLKADILESSGYLWLKDIIDIGRRAASYEKATAENVETGIVFLHAILDSSPEVDQPIRERDGL